MCLKGAYFLLAKVISFPFQIRRRRLARLETSQSAPSSASASPVAINIPQPSLNITAIQANLSNRLNVDAKTAASPSSASVLYGMTPPSFCTLDSGIDSQSMDVDGEDGEKGEKRTQSMLTPPTDGRFKRQHITDDKDSSKVCSQLS